MPVPRANLEAYRASHPSGQACNCSALSAAIASCLLGLDLSSSTRYNSQPPSTINRDHHGDPLRPLFVRSAGTLPLRRQRPQHLQLHPRFAASNPQGPAQDQTGFGFCVLLTFPVIVHPPSPVQRKLHTTRAAQCLARSAHSPSQLRPGLCLSATGAIAIPCWDHLAQSPCPPDVRNSLERRSLFHRHRPPPPGRQTLQYCQNRLITAPTRAHGSFPQPRRRVVNRHVAHRHPSALPIRVHHRPRRRPL